MLRRTHPAIATALTCTLVATAGCRRPSAAEGKGALLSADMPLTSYVQSAVGANGRRQTRLFFPLLQIYNSSGALVYVSHDANQNAETLRALPDSIAGRGAISDTASLADVVAHTPSLQANRQVLVHSTRATALSVVLENCHACSVQEEALDETQKRLLDRGVNLLILHVARPI